MSIVKFKIKEDNGVTSTVILENKELNTREISTEFCLAYYKCYDGKSVGECFKQIIRELNKYNDFKIIHSAPTFTLNSEINDIDNLLYTLNLDQDEFYEFVEWSES